MRETLELTVPPHEVVGRIATATDNRRLALNFTGFDGSKQYISEIEGYSFNINKRSMTQSTYDPFMFGTLEPKDGGSRLILTSSLSRTGKSSLVFSSCFFVLAFAFVVVKTGFDTDKLLFGLVLAILWTASHILWPKIRGGYVERDIMRFIEELFADSIVHQS